MSFLMGNKKRDTSRNGEESKKNIEDYDNINSMSDYVFSGGLNSPNCTKTLINMRASRIIKKVQTLKWDQISNKDKLT